MNEMMELEKVLQIATSSPDPAVRRAAVHYRKLLKEADDLKGFFSFYEQALTEAKEQVPVRIVPQQVKTRASSTRSSMDAFIRRVCDLLTGNGQPIGISRLYEEFYQKYADEDRVSLDTFRQRLIKKREHVSLLSGRGYWPAGAAVPEEDSLAA